MCHSRLVGRHVDIAAVGAAFQRGDDRHVPPLFDLGKEEPLPVDPQQALRVGEPRLRRPSEHGNGPRVPGKAIAEHGVSDARTIRREHGTHLAGVVVGDLHWLAVRKHLDVELGLADKSIRAAEKRQRAAIGRQRGLGNRVGQVG